MAPSQNLTMPTPITIFAIDKQSGDIMIIREENYNAEIHVRCNKHGQEVDEHGVVLPTAAKVKPPEQQASAKNSAKPDPSK